MYKAIVTKAFLSNNACLGLSTLGTGCKTTAKSWAHTRTINRCKRTGRTPSFACVLPRSPRSGIACEATVGWCDSSKLRQRACRSTWTCRESWQPVAASSSTVGFAARRYWRWSCCRTAGCRASPSSRPSWACWGRGRRERPSASPASRSTPRSARSSRSWKTRVSAGDHFLVGSSWSLLAPY